MKAVSHSPCGCTCLDKVKAYAFTMILCLDRVLLSTVIGS